MFRTFSVMLLLLISIVIINGTVFAASTDNLFVGDEVLDSSILSEKTNIDPSTINLLPAVPDTLEGTIQAIKDVPSDLSLYPKVAALYSKNNGSGFKVFAKGNPVDFSKYDNVMPAIVGGRTLVPVRAMAEGLGAQVAFNDATQEISITLGDTLVKLKVNSAEATVNGAANTLEVPATTINGRTMIPLRFVGEAFGKRVGWYPSGDAKVISITD